MGGLLMGEKFAWGDHRLEPIHLAGWGLHQNLQDAEVYCSQIADAHYENFLIANKFTPPKIKQHIQNIYAFCRYGDDLGDEAPFDSQGRLTLLDAWEKDLEEAHQGIGQKTSASNFNCRTTHSKNIQDTIGTILETHTSFQDGSDKKQISLMG